MTATCTTSFVVPGSVQVVASVWRRQHPSWLDVDRPDADDCALAPSTTSLTVTPNPAQVGQARQPHGDGDSGLGDGNRDVPVERQRPRDGGRLGGGAASAIVNLPEGTHQIQASYSGD